jgi:hypothetical protein
MKANPTPDDEAIVYGIKSITGERAGFSLPVFRQILKRQGFYWK